MPADISSDESIVETIRNTIKSYPNFPKDGIIFQDFFPIFRNPLVFKSMVSVLVNHIKQAHPETEAIVGLESRGFLLGPVLSYELAIPFIPIRKSGKLPGEVQQISYSLEYGKDSIEIQTEAMKNGLKCIIIDDLMATGGTMKASISLLEKCNATILDCIVIIELLELNGREKLNVPLYSLVKI